MTPFRCASWFAAVSLLAGVACRSRSSHGVGTTHAELRTDYADLFQVLGPRDLERWVAVRTKLRAGLDRACATSTCAGYSDLATVQVTCSASIARHTMRECAWVVGGSVDAIDGATGAHLGDARAITCTLPTRVTTSAFLDALDGAGDAAFDTPLPGTGRSLHDGLVSCLAAPDAGTVLPSTGPATDFVALDDLLAIGTEQGDGWRSVGRALQGSFDDACGDTFCEGDYGDIRALRLSCAANRQSALVHGCTWSFAMATTDVAADGAVVPTTATRSCPVVVDAPASELLSTLAGNDPLHASLPGSARSLNDALIGCL